MSYQAHPTMLKVEDTGRRMVHFTIHLHAMEFISVVRYLSGLKKMGGLDAMKERNEEKAKILYDFLDQSKLFKGTVVPKKTVHL